MIWTHVLFILAMIDVLKTRLVRLFNSYFVEFVFQFMASFWWAPTPRTLVTRRNVRAATSTIPGSGNRPLTIAKILSCFDQRTTRSYLGANKKRFPIVWMPDFTSFRIGVTSWPEHFQNWSVKSRLSAPNGLLQVFGRQSSKHRQTDWLLIFL